MQIGILGGTFDPPHLGHLYIAQQAMEDKDLDEVWLVPNAGLGTYGKTPKASPSARLDMCDLSVLDFNSGILKEECPVKVLSVEIDQAKGLFCTPFEFGYTYQLVEFLKEEYKRDTFHLILGDWDITKFKNWERITVERIELIQVQRPQSCVDCLIDGNPANEEQDISFRLSSTIIRKRISEGKKVTGLVTPSVEKYIIDNNLYKGVNLGAL